MFNYLMEKFISAINFCKILYSKNIYYDVEYGEYKRSDIRNITFLMSKIKNILFGDKITEKIKNDSIHEFPSYIIWNYGNKDVIEASQDTRYYSSRENPYPLYKPSNQKGYRNTRYIQEN